MRSVTNKMRWNVANAITSLIMLIMVTNAHAGIVFSDDFEAGVSPEWGNEIGNWTITNGVYAATNPNNSPPTLTMLPYDMRNFSIDVDVNDIQDGGIWMRMEFHPKTGTPLNGVLLVTGGNLGTYSGFYWHTVTNGAYSNPLNFSGTGLFTPGVSDVSIRVEVINNTYSMYLNDEITPSTTLSTNAFCTGTVGLYDFSGQTFDNFELSDLIVDCPADIIRSGVVDVLDLLELLANWDTDGICGGDLNNDEVVNVTDLLVLISAWGPCP